MKIMGGLLLYKQMQLHFPLPKENLKNNSKLYYNILQWVPQKCSWRIKFHYNLLLLTEKITKTSYYWNVICDYHSHEPDI